MLQVDHNFHKYDPIPLPLRQTFYQMFSYQYEPNLRGQNNVVLLQSQCYNEPFHAPSFTMIKSSML